MIISVFPFEMCAVCLKVSAKTCKISQVLVATISILFWSLGQPSYVREVIAMDMNEEAIKSLSDDEKEEIEDKLTSLSPSQRDELQSNGYCVLDNKHDKFISAVQGYIRSNFGTKCMAAELIQTIVDYYSSRYNRDIYTELVFINGCSMESATWLVPKNNLTLSTLLNARMDIGQRIEIDQSKVQPDAMHNVLGYLGHHRGIQPAQIPKPLGSSDLNEVLEDPWDAKFIGGLNHNDLFMLIIAVNYLDCKCLLDLSCVAIACKIKGNRLMR